MSQYKREAKRTHSDGIADITTESKTTTTTDLDHHFNKLKSLKVSKVSPSVLQPILSFTSGAQGTRSLTHIPSFKLQPIHPGYPSDGEHDIGINGTNRNENPLVKSPFNLLDRFLTDNNRYYASDTCDSCDKDLELVNSPPGSDKSMESTKTLGNNNHDHDNRDEISSHNDSNMPPTEVARMEQVHTVPQLSIEQIIQEETPPKPQKRPSRPRNRPPKPQFCNTSTLLGIENPEVPVPDIESESEKEPQFVFPDVTSSPDVSPGPKRTKHPPITMSPLLHAITEEKGSGEKKRDLKKISESQRNSTDVPQMSDSKEMEPDVMNGNVDMLRRKSDPSVDEMMTPSEEHHTRTSISKHRKHKSDPSDIEIIKEPPDLGSTTSIDTTNGRTASVTSEDSGRETPSTPSATSVTPTDERPAQENKKPPKAEMREHVLQNLYNTEKSYVFNLNQLVTSYLEPLKRSENSHMIEIDQVDDIFYNIPEILHFHESFFDEIECRYNSWSDEQVLGDIFLRTFTDPYLIESYVKFVTHFNQSKEVIRNTILARPALQKYLDKCRDESKDKLGLADILIMPVARIPRYELILKEFLKYTPVDHPDHDDCSSALDQIQSLARQMDKCNSDAQQAEKDVSRLRGIQETIDGLTELVTSSRKFIRQDLVAEKMAATPTTKETFKKDRCLFLFSDLLVCTNVRKKNVALRRGSLGLFTGSTPAEFQRFRFLWKVALEEVEIVKGHNSFQPKLGGKEMEVYEKDLKLLETITVTTKQLDCEQKVELEAQIRKIKQNIVTKIQELQSSSPPAAATLSPQHSEINIQIQSEDGSTPTSYKFHFLSAECKSSWEAYFADAKQKLAYAKDTTVPEFQYLMPITKTRSGMQFTCAAPTHLPGSYDYGRSISSSCDVWVCNSDGYVGQVCLLSLVPEADSKACISVCSSKILCVAVVPGGSIVNTKSGEKETRNRVDNPDTISVHKVESEHIMAFDSEDEGDEEDDEERESGIGNSYMGSNSAFGRMSPDGSSLGTRGSAESIAPYDSADDDDSSSDSSRRRSGRGGSLRKGTNEFVSTDFLDTTSGNHSTMWLGTQDGYLCIYPANETIPTQKKTKMKVSHGGAGITDILYFENKVFVALSNGELCIYKHDASNNGWQLATPQKFQVSLTGSGIICMTAVAGRVWCGCQHQVILVNATTLKIENTLTISTDSHRQIHQIVSSGLGVWISLQSSSIIKLYHATTYENLNEVDIAPAVHKMLTGADAIIRQHKSACLRVTALLICKDLLWIGTSAGVILTNPLPSITASTSALSRGCSATGSPHGHTGHVRFITSVEVPRSLYTPPVDCDSQKTSSSPKRLKDKSNSSSSINNLRNPCSSDTITLVISGGDGYEDFRSNHHSDTVGRDDSTNHLLVWKV